MSVIQKKQNIAGTLSLRSARSGTKFEVNLSLSTDGLKAPANVFVFCVTRYKFSIVSQLLNCIQFERSGESESIELFHLKNGNGNRTYHRWFCIIKKKVYG